MNEVMIQKKYFIGTSSKTEWSSVYTYKPHNVEYKEKKGEIFAAICLKGPETFSLDTAGGLLLDRFHELYFENTKDSVMISLENACIKTGEFLQQILKNDNADKEGIDLSFISMVIHKDIAYIVALGGGKIYALRDEQINEISSVLKDPTGEGLIKEASFVIKEGDLYLIGTPYVDKEILRSEFEKALIEFSEKPFKNRIFDNPSLIAFLILGYNYRKKIDFVEEEKEIEKEDEPLSDVEFIENSEDEYIENIEKDDDEENDKEEEDDDDKEVYIDNESIDPLPNADKEELEEVFEEAEEIPASPSIVIKNRESFSSKIKKSINSLIDKIKSKRREKAINSVHNRINETEEDSHSRIKDIEKKKDIESMKTYQVVLYKIKNFFIGIFNKIKETVWDNWLGLGGNYGDVYAKAQARKRRYGIVFVLIIFVIAILYYSIDGAVNNQKQKEAEELALSRFTEIQNQLQEISDQSIYLIAASGNDERKIKALNSLNEIEDGFNELNNIDSLKEKITIELAVISELRNKFNRVIVNNDINVLTDIGDIYPDTNPVDIDASNGRVYILDSKGGTVFSFDYSGGSMAKVAEGFNEPISLSIDNNNNTLIVLDKNKDNALSVINLTNNSVNKMAASAYSKVEGTTQIETALIGGKEPRLYLLNPNKKTISYYARSGNTYGTLILRNTWDELAGATDFKIDEGRIYLTLKKNLGLYRDYMNKEDTINITRMSSNDSFVNASAIYVDGVYVYIADPENRRVLVFKKGTPDIAFVAQYKYTGNDENIFKNIKEIVADRNSNKVFVLDSTKVVVLDMNLLKEFE